MVRATTTSQEIGKVGAVADETGAGGMTSSDDNSTLRLLRDARGHLGLRRFDLAVEVATQAIRLDPRRSETYVIRAEALRKLNKSDRALADLALAIRLAPDRPAPYVIRAEIYRGRCQHDQAIADATQAIFLDPNSAAAYSIRASCRLTIGDPEGAAADQEELFRIDPIRPLVHTPNSEKPGSSSTTVPIQRDAYKDLFADGKPADTAYRSRRVVSDEDAPEILGTASGYKPETVGRPIPRHRTARRGPQVSPVLGGVVLLGLISGGALLLNQNRAPQDKVGKPAGTTTAVKSEPVPRAGSPTPPVPSDVVPAVPAVAQASTRPGPEPVSSPPQVAGPSARLQEVAQLGGSDKKVWWVDLDGAGTRAVTAEDRHLKLWDFRSGFQDLKPTVLCSNDASVSGIMTAAFLPGSENVVTGHWNGEVRVWDTRRRPPSIGKVVKKLPDLVPWIAVSPDGKLVATGVRKLGQVDLWQNPGGDYVEFRGVYEVKGDRLRLCYKDAKDEVVERPTGFQTDDRSGTEFVPLNLRRDDDEQAAPTDGLPCRREPDAGLSRTADTTVGRTGRLTVGGPIPCAPTPESSCPPP